MMKNKIHCSSDYSKGVCIFLCNIAIRDHCTYLKSSFFRRAVVGLAKVKSLGKSHFAKALTLDVRDVAQVQIKFKFFIFFGLVHQSQ